MKKLSIYAVLVLMLLVFGCTEKEILKPGNDLIVAAYLPHWGMDRVDMNSLNKLDILYYFSLAPDENGLFTVPEGMIADLDNIKDNIDSRTLLFLVLGGWYESATIFPMFADPDKRASYISQLVEFCIDHDIDGVDLDWEDYPIYIPPQDRSILTSEMSASLRANGLLFSIALVPSQVAFSAGVHPLVDYINVMSYGVLDQGGAHAPLSMFEDYVYDHIYAGVPKEKIIMGVPFYAKRPYRAGDTSPRTYPYSTIVDLAHPPAGLNNYGDYSFNGRTLIRRKTAFLIENDIGGIMAWELSQDVLPDSPYSLFSAILDAAGR